MERLLKKGKMNLVWRMVDLLGHFKKRAWLIIQRIPIHMYIKDIHNTIITKPINIIYLRPKHSSPPFEEEVSVVLLSHEEHPTMIVAYPIDFPVKLDLEE